MDRNCVSVGNCLFPNLRWRCDVTCTALSKDGSVLASGTRQGYVVLWKVRKRRQPRRRCPLSIRRFKEAYESTADVSLDPYFLLLASNNPIAFPVVQVAFASGSRPLSSLKHSPHRVISSYCGVEKAEEVLVSLHKDNSIAVWSLTDCRCLHKVKGPPFAIKRLCVLPDDRFVALVGRSKINVIDLWRIKLIGMLDLSGTCYFDKVIYSNRTHDSNGGEAACSYLAMDTSNASKFNMSPRSAHNQPVYTKPTRILRAQSGLVPADSPFALDDVTTDLRHGTSSGDRDDNVTLISPILLSALLDNHELVVWDLTEPIMNYKQKYGTAVGPIAVVTRWDRQNEQFIQIQRRQHHGHRGIFPLRGRHSPTKAGSSSKNGVSKNGAVEVDAEFPTLREWIPELKDAESDLCSVDRYVFLMLDVRILVWYYDTDGSLTRVAELLSLGTDGVSIEAPWRGFECVRVSHDLTFLVAWVGSGRVSIFSIPDVYTPNKPFQLVAKHQLPAFTTRSRLGECLHVHVNLGSRHHDDLDFSKNISSSLRFRLIRRTSVGDICIGMPHHKSWLRVCTTSLLSDCFSGHADGVVSSALFHDGNFLHRVDMLRCGSLSCTNVTTGVKRELGSCHYIEECIRHMSSGCRLRSLALPGSKVMEWLSGSSGNSSCSPQYTGRVVLHCLGSSYLVVCTGMSCMMVYSLSSFELSAVLWDIHRAPVNAIHSVFSISFYGSKTTDAVLNEIEDTYVSVDSDGCLVLVQLPLLLSDLSEHSPRPNIEEKDIYSDATISDDAASHSSSRESFEYYVSSSSERKGIQRMQRSVELLEFPIERVALNRETETLYVLTHRKILLWRISDGRFLRSLPYLATYRQAVWVSSDTTAALNRKQPGPTLASTLTSFLTTDWPSTTSTPQTEGRHRLYLENRQPHDLLAPCIFQEKCFKKRVSMSLHMSFLRMDFCVSPSSDSDISYEAPDDEYKRPVNGHQSRVRAKLLRQHSQSHHICNCWRVWICRRRGHAHSGFRTICSHYCRPSSHGDNLRSLPTISHSVPMVLFPLQKVLSHLNGSGGSLLPKIKDHGAVCYLGVPPGTFSIPLRYRKMKADDSHSFVHHKMAVTTYFSNDYLHKETRWPSIRRSFTFPCMFDERKIALPVPRFSAGQCNRYYSTCMYIRDMVIAFHAKSKAGSYWEGSADAWLLLHLLLLCTCKTGYPVIYNSVLGSLRQQSCDDLYLHVCRALSALRCFHTKSGSRVPFPEMRVCRFHATTFSFGRRCGFCLQPAHFVDVGGTSNLAPPPPWEEDASLLLLVMIATDKRLSMLCNYVSAGDKIQTFANYVAQLMFRHMLTTDETPSPSGDYPPENRIFDPRTYCLEMFDGGFASVWTLKSLDNSRILPASFGKNRVHALARSLYHSSNGRHLSSEQFVMSALSLYRSTKSEHWLSILRRCYSLDTSQMIRIIRWIVRERRVDKWYIETTVKLLLEFVTENRDRVVEHLPDVVVIVVRCLDPSDSSVRMLMLKSATSALFQLVKNFPMAAFYQDTQRFAVGSVSGHVVIYDLRTATKCRILGGDIKGVASLAFSSTGDYIAAYYMDPPCLVIWNCSSSGLLGTLLHSGKRDQKVVKLKRVEPNPSTTAMDIKIQSKSNREWFLHREDGRGYMVSI
ncbi:WD G-beta repeat-containing protein, putative [Babesia ovata]|uniref:WD G-beta repeat-containing protein, putative n=1 Tax=Babesia ovata TaxID=189622 RepID=A0A2H6KFC5_9APIC|nr:WD G-beta repeat-containing protein, putative [Babesia ovata]GBE61692.1 WD G-beta repeat-containing protein, putative [Babesia ovata]